MFKDRELRKMFGFERVKVNRGWITLHRKSFVICTYRQTDSRSSIQDRRDGRGTWQALGEKSEAFSSQETRSKGLIGRFARRR
jgi:hypothetical protein